MANNYKCPYCSRKISYTTRLVEHGQGEHNCSHCQKPSNITQSKGIWRLFTLCTLAAGIIMIFYLLFGNIIQDSYDENGSLGFLVALFFGKGKEIKWIIWELIPFAVFFFVSPKYMNFIPLRKFMEQTPSKIDLTIPTPQRKSNNTYKSEFNTRTIPKVDQEEFTGEYEDISSSSLEKTRNFSVNDAVNVTPASTSTSSSYRSDAPLRRVNSELERDVLREAEYYAQAERVKSEKNQPVQRETAKPSQNNFSGNRKF